MTLSDYRTEAHEVSCEALAELRATLKNRCIGAAGKQWLTGRLEWWACAEALLETHLKWPPIPPANRFEYECEAEAALDNLADMRSVWAVDKEHLATLLDDPGVPLGNDKSGQQLPVSMPFTHTDNYDSILWLGESYVLTPTQAALIKELDERRLSGHLEVRIEAMRELIHGITGGVTSRPSDIFRKHKTNAVLWGSLIIPVRRGIYRLNI